MLQVVVVNTDEQMSRRVFQTLLSEIRTRLTRSQNRSKNVAKNVWEAYEDLIGIRDIRRTHQSVLSAENMFVAASKARRDVHSRLSEIQQNLKQVRQKLDSTSRTDETYLELVTREHQLFKEESKVMKDLMEQENVERDLFDTFSQNLRDCQEVERMRQEKTKYLSLLGSLIGAALGIIGTSINHALKNRDFKKILAAIESKNHKEQSAFNEVEHRPNEPPNDSDIVEKVSSRVIAQVNEREKPREAEIFQRIGESESSLQYRMKVNAICTVTATYILIAVTLPLIMRLCGD